MNFEIGKMNVFKPRVDNHNDLPNEKGVYIISISSERELPERMRNLKYSRIGSRLILYVGLSRKGIKSRDYRNHFNGSARVSTLRKSLGSLMGYEPIEIDKRGKYKFKENDEEELSEWMKENLFIHYVTCEEIEEIEKYLISELNPPLNLRDNHNIENIMFRRDLKAWRKK